MIVTEDEARAYVAECADEAALKRMELYISLLADENERQNLVAKASIAEIWQRHVADSAQLLAHVPRETIDGLAQNGIWLDLGTGAGFPGLAIAILRPEWDVRLVESRRKRAIFLEDVRIELGLRKCSVIGSRLEMVSEFTASVISARAFAPMPRLLDLSARFSTERTLWLLPKGRSAAQDLAQLPESTRALFHVEQSCTDSEAGLVVGRLQHKGGIQQMRRKA